MALLLQDDSGFAEVRLQSPSGAAAFLVQGGLCSGFARMVSPFDEINQRDDDTTGDQKRCVSLLIDLTSYQYLWWVPRSTFMRSSIWQALRSPWIGIPTFETHPAAAAQLLGWSE